MIFLSNSKSTLIKPLIYGLISAVITSFIMMLIGALVVKNFDLDEIGVLIISLISMSTGAFVGGFIAAKINKQKGFLVGILNGIAFFILNTVLAFILNTDSMTIISVIKVILFVITSMIGGIIGVNYSRKRKI